MSKDFIRPNEPEIPKLEEKCPYCGEPLGDDKEFCHKCGKFLGKKKHYSPVDEKKARIIRITLGIVVILIFLVIYLLARRD